MTERIMIDPPPDHVATAPTGRSDLKYVHCTALGGGWSGIGPWPSWVPSEANSRDGRLKFPKTICLRNLTANPEIASSSSGREVVTRKEAATARLPTYPVSPTSGIASHTWKPEKCGPWRPKEIPKCQLLLSFFALRPWLVPNLKPSWAHLQKGNSPSGVGQEDQ